MPSSPDKGVRPRLRAPMTLVVIPEECQSIPITAPNDWNRKGCANRRSSCATPLRLLFDPSPVPETYAGFPASLTLRPSQIRASAEDGLTLRAWAERTSLHDGE